MKFVVTRPERALSQMQREAAQFRKDLRRASVNATDRASKDAQRAVQQKIREVGLGRLGGAVGHTSLKREGKGDTAANPYGVIFARGGDDSSGGGTLEAYSKGTTIQPRAGNDWLWIATKAVPKFIRAGGRRFRTTPRLYNNSGLVATIGQLVFKPISGTRALLVIRKASVNIRTGRARTPTNRASKASTREKDVIAFVGIKITRRAKRFSQRDIMRAYSRKLPEYLQDELDRLGSSRG